MKSRPMGLYQLLAISRDVPRSASIELLYSLLFFRNLPRCQTGSVGRGVI